MLTLRLRQITTFREMLIMRTLRNACAHYMTRNRSKIGYLKQWRTWQAWRKPGAEFVPYLAWVQDSVVGYGIVRGPWVSGGIHPAVTGYGLGEQLFRRLLAEVYRTEPICRLEVWAWNTRALRLYTKLGFQPVRGAEGIIEMERPWG